MKVRISLWPPLFTAALGIWLILAARVIGYENSDAALIDGIIGPAMTVVSVVALWEFMAGLRWINVLLGCALVFSPLLYGSPTPSALANSVIVGLFAVGVSLLDRKPRRSYGGGWSSLWKEDTDWMKIKFE